MRARLHTATPGSLSQPMDVDKVLLRKCPATFMAHTQWLVTLIMLYLLLWPASVVAIQNSLYNCVADPTIDLPLAALWSVISANLLWRFCCAQDTLICTLFCSTWSGHFSHARTNYTLIGVTTPCTQGTNYTLCVQVSDCLYLLPHLPQSSHPRRSPHRGHYSELAHTVGREQRRRSSSGNSYIDTIHANLLRGPSVAMEVDKVCGVGEGVGGCGAVGGCGMWGM